MHDSNHTDAFETYLQDEVSEHRMYPSDRVWKNIRSQIQKPKKWPALSVFTVLIISALVIGTILNKPLPDAVTLDFVYSLQSPVNNSKSLAKDKKVKSIQQEEENSYSITQLTSHTIIAAVEKIKNENAINNQFNNALSAIQNISTGASAQNTTAADISTAKQTAKNEIAPEAVPSAQTSFTSFRNIDNYLFDITSRLKSILNSEPSFDHYSGGGVAFYSSNKNAIPYSTFNLPAGHKDLFPSLNKLGNSSSNFDFRFYFTPSVSYRRLADDEQKSNDNTATSGASLESDNRISPSKAINQSPAIGYETGVGLGYKLNKRLSLVGGFQFNISQYKINAFSYKNEPTAVTLNEGEYASTVNTVSSLRSMSGNAPLTIKNRYYQLSMPLGVEWLILNKGKFSWGVGASVQPTYTFDKQPLIISSNYKNYADGSAYVRNWNVNANAETFLGYTTGSYRWQIGPQFRYQMLPSLVDKYPNKEYLLNYGLKLGIVKQLK